MTQEARLYVKNIKEKDRFIYRIGGYQRAKNEGIVTFEGENGAKMGYREDTGGYGYSEADIKFYRDKLYSLAAKVTDCIDFVYECGLGIGMQKELCNTYLTYAVRTSFNDRFFVSESESVRLMDNSKDELFDFSMEIMVLSPVVSLRKLKALLAYFRLFTGAKTKDGESNIVFDSKKTEEKLLTLQSTYKDNLDMWFPKAA